MSAPLALVARKFRDHDVTAIRFGGEPVFLFNEIELALGNARGWLVRQLPRWENGGHIRPDIHYHKLTGERLAAFKAEVSNCYANCVAVDGHTRNLLVLTERGLYRVLQLASTPIAMAFQDWLEEEVLPSINATGGYQALPAITALPDPVDVPGAKTLLQAATLAVRCGDANAAAAFLRRYGSVMGAEVTPVLKIPVTQAAKRAAVEDLLAEHPELPDREIARQAGVSHTYVAKLRPARPVNSTIRDPLLEELRTLRLERDCARAIVTGVTMKSRRGRDRG